jgi:PAS domain S-box-containing protein
MGILTDLIWKNPAIKRVGFVVFLLILAASVFIFIAAFQQTQHILTESTEREGLASATTASGMIDGNLLGSLRPGDENTVAYKTIQDELNRIRQTNPDIRYIYTAKRVNGKITFLVDADYGNPVTTMPGAKIGDPYLNATPSMMNGFYSPVSETDFTTDAWGSVFSSYAPVYNQRHEMVGIVGIDMDGSTISSGVATIKILFLLVMLITFALAISLATFTATMQEQAYKTLRENEEYHKTIMQSIQAGVLILDAETNTITDVNAKALSMIRAEKERIFGQSGHTFISLSGTEGNAVPDTIQTIENSEGTLIDITGQKIPVILSINTITLGGKSMLIESFVDISERKKMEEQNALLIRELETANAELKDFAYIVSHDLKAPLRAIGSLSQWLYTDYEDKFDEDGKTQLDLLVNRVHRMQNLIEGILEYSRVGRVHEQKENVGVDAVLREVIDSLSIPPQIAVTVETPLPTLWYEKTRLHQVFSNLIGNAIKYMNKPTGEIHIGCIEDGSFWKFSIRDNGPGIDSRHYEKIFQIFQTLQPRDQIESTGIGLSIVKKIVEMNGGRIWVDSEIGKGSVFYFTVPISRTADGGSP